MKAHFRRDSRVGTVLNILKMVINIRAHISLANSKARVAIIGAMVQYMRVSLRMACVTVVVFGVLAMPKEISTKVSMKMISSMALESINGQMVHHTRDTSIKIKSMVREC